jgi:hypothetical protein
MTGQGDAHIQAIDFHNTQKLSVIGGNSTDSAFTTCSGSTSNPFIAAMHLSSPEYLWAKSICSLPS